MKTKHGQIIGKILYKRGKSVVKYWKYDGYAIPLLELLKVDGVKLYTKYDGNLYASRETFNKHGIVNLFDTGKGMEQQLILPVEYWESV